MKNDIVIKRATNGFVIENHIWMKDDKNDRPVIEKELTAINESTDNKTLK